MNRVRNSFVSSRIMINALAQMDVIFVIGSLDYLTGGDENGRAYEGAAS